MQAEPIYKMPIGSNFPTLPGRVANSGIYVVRFGETRTYMYMTPEKEAATRKLVEAVNNKSIKLCADVYENPRTTEFSAIPSILPEPITVDHLDSVVQNDDFYGQTPLNEYAVTIRDIAQKTLHLGPLFAVSREINLIISHDAHTFHKDSFPKQFEYLQTDPGLTSCSLVHDLTLVDWDMAQSTVSGTIFHDPISHDRFLLALLPRDMFGTFSIEPINYGEGTPPKDPGASLLPYHAVLSPEDLESNISAGSSKGQRISSVLRGLIKDEDTQEIDRYAKELKVNRPIIDDSDKVIYGNGILFRSIHAFPNINTKQEKISKLVEKDNVQLIEYTCMEPSLDGIPESLREIFGIPKSFTYSKHTRISKKDGGFNPLINLERYGANDRIIIVNNSEVPEGYKHYPLSEDQSDLGKPWIQMYQFRSGMAMDLNSTIHERLSLTPVLELLYRDEKTDCGRERAATTKLATHLDFYIFKNKE
jgi:hypothetical protein